MTTNQLPMRQLTRGGLQVTAIGLGLWVAGGGDWGGNDDRDSLAAIETALDAGVNFFDTADVYGGGHSETLLGRAMAGRRARFVVASKIGWLGFDDARKLSAYTSVAKIVAAVEAGLARMQTAYLDVLQRHVDFADPTLDVWLDAMDELKARGLIGAWGISTSDFDYIQRANARGTLETLQIDYSILNRTPEREILPYCQQHGIGVIVRGPLAMGILAGKFTPQTRFAAGDFRARWHDNPAEYAVYLDDLRTVAALQALLPADRTLAQLALQFVLAHPAVSTVIPGARNPRQAQMNIAAGLLPPLDAPLRAAIDALVPPGGGRRIWPA